MSSPDAVQLTPSFHLDDVEIIECQSQYQGFFSIDKYHLRHKLFAGGKSDRLQRELFERGQAAAVLLYDPDVDKIVLLEQFRIGALADQRSPWLLEVVAGIIEQGETAQEVAIREAQEEAGCDIQQLEKISEYWVSPGGTSEKIHLYLAHVNSQQLTRFHGLEEEGEDIQLHILDRQQAYEMIAEGSINNAATIIALQWLQLKILENIKG